MAVRSSHRRGAGVRVVELPRSEFIDDITAVIADAGLTMDRFVELGRSGELRDDRLRDLWLMAGSEFE